MTNKVWVRVNGGNWNASALANPATGVGGSDISALAGLPIAPILHGSSAGNQTANFGASGFAQAVPAGFTSGWPKSGGGFTTLDPTKLYGFGALSGGNLTFTAGVAGFGACQSADAYTAGKYYFEVTFNAHGFITDLFGSGVGRVYPGISFNSFVQNNGGYNAPATPGGVDIYINFPVLPASYRAHLGVLGTLITDNLFTYQPGDVLCWAVDMGAIPPPAGAAVTVADLWFGPTVGFTDLSQVNNRRKFISAGGATQNLGTDGSNPFGGAPPVFLTRASTDIADVWAANRGTGGTYAITGGDLTVAGSQPPCSTDTVTTTTPVSLGSPPGTGPVRGLHVFGGDLYAITGAAAQQVSAIFGITNLGNIGSSTDPVSMTDNGLEVAFVDGQGGYLVRAGALSVISMPFDNPTTIAMIDGFGLASFAGSNKIAQSNELDLNTWDPLSFGVAGSTPAPIVAIHAIHGELWVLKTDTTEVWVDAGTAGFAFAPQASTHIQEGCIAPFSVATAGETLCWLGQNSQGQGIVVQAIGYQAKPISTQALVNEIAKYGDIGDAIGYSYQQSGHVFYVLTFPSADRTWCYDLTASAMAGYPLWHRRAAFDNGLFHRHWGNAFARWSASGTATLTGVGVIGDYRNGNLYAFNLDTVTDNGDQRRWLRTWRALEKAKDTTTRFSSLTLIMETGAQVPDGANPQCVLRWSDDGGHTWSDERISAVGPLGATAQNVRFTRLGSTMRFGRADRIFELSSTDPFKVAIIGADVEAS